MRWAERVRVERSGIEVFEQELGGDAEVREGKLVVGCTPAAAIQGMPITAVVAPAVLTRKRRRSMNSGNLPHW
ncbi:MAG: hypothetical protein H0U00_01900 [Actinobacteria bacterium]|nr:hypothetical protein [Actinomycetota bacterium]